MKPEKFLPTENSGEYLPAIEVNNIVLWVNTNFDLPFKIEVGHSSHLGLFLTQKGEDSAYSLEILPTHGRSAVFDRKKFTDKSGNQYQEIELKGVGHVKKDPLYPEVRSKSKVGKIEPRVNPAVLEPGAMGILDLKNAETDKSYSEFLYENGIRVSRTLAIIELQEIVDENGEKKTADEAKKLGLIPFEITPVIEVRAFVTRARISDYDSDNWDNLFEKARQLVAQEQDIDQAVLSKEAYLKWFAKTLGSQVAKLQKLNLYHGYLTPQNITLDCRLVDFDSVTKLDELDEKTRNRLETNIKKMVGSCPKNLNLPTLAKLYDYVRAFSSLDKLTQQLELSVVENRELIKEISSNFHTGYVEAGGEELPAIE